MLSESHSNGSEQLYDIYSTWHMPWWQSAWMYCLLGGVILCVGVAALLYVLRIRRRRAIKPWDKALIALNRLHEQGLTTVVHSKEFYTALTILLKTYLQDRYGFNLVGTTDEEIMVYLERQSFDPSLLESLRAIFNGSVIIKFANASAIKEQIECDFAASREFIYKTIPVEKS